MKSRLFTGAFVRVGVDLEGALDAEVGVPAHLLRALVDVALVAVVEARDAREDARGEPRFEVRRVGELEGALEVDARVARLDLLRAQPGELLGQRAREPARAGREELHRGRVLARHLDGGPPAPRAFASASPCGAGNGVGHGV